MLIKNLKDSLEDFDKISECHQEEWAHLNDKETLEGRKERMQPYLSDKFIPSMYVAKEENELIGTAAIIECDLDTRSDLTPWMASIYVLPNHRKKGYSKVLVKHIMEQAKLNGIKKMYLYTEDADQIYAKLGWKIICKDQCHGNDIVIMETNL